MTSKGRVWGIILSCALAGAAACDMGDHPGGADSGAGGKQTHAGGSPNATGGGDMTDGGVTPGGFVGQSGGVGGQTVGGQAGGSVGGRATGGAAAGGEAGQSLGGSNGQGTEPRPLSCPDGGGGYDGWYSLGGAGGTADAEFHRVTLGTKQTAIAINDSGKMLVTSGWDDADSCQAWVVDADSVSEVTTVTSGCVLAVDMNEAGTVLASQGSVPFLWKDGVATPLEGVASGIPVALNDAEQVVLRDSPMGPALWEGGTLTPLRTPADEVITAVAINESGQVIGYSGGNANRAEETWLWDEGSASALGLSAVHALNDVGDIAGVMNDEEGIWSGGTFTPLLAGPGPGGLTPTDLNDMRIQAMTDDGVLVGDVYGIGEIELARPFVIEAGVFRYLGSGSARDINHHGEIVGRYTSIKSTPLPCLECWDLTGFSATLWVRDCPSACCAP